MHSFLLLSASIAIILVAGTIAWLASGIMRELRKFGNTAEDLSHFLQVAEEEITNTTREARIVMHDVDEVIRNVNGTVEIVEKVASEAHRLLDLAYVATATAKAVKSSTAGLASVYEGVKQGIRALYGSEQTKKGGTQHE